MPTARHAAGLLLTAVLVSGAQARAASGYPYTVTALVPLTPGQGSGVALMINDRGLICGFLSNNAGYCYRHGAVTRLVPLTGDAWAIPAGLNDRGQVVGYSYGPDRPRTAVIFVDGAAHGLAVDSHASSIANDINNLGQIVGGSGGVQDQSSAYLLDRGTVRELGTLGGERRIDAATSINDRGQVIAAIDFDKLTGMLNEPRTCGLQFKVNF